MEPLPASCKPSPMPNGSFKIKKEEVSYITEKAKEKSPGGDCVPTELFKQADDNYCLAFADYIQNYVRGKFDEEYTAHLTGGKLIILTKPNGGIRPIVVQSAIYRIMAKVLAKKALGELTQDLRPYQFGLESNGLVPIAITSSLQNNPNYTLMSIDIENAYGSIKRSHILSAATQSSSEWLPHYVWQTYSQPTNVSHQGEDYGMPTNTGVLQGDPMSMLLFATTIRDAIKTTAEKHPQVQPLAFADDISLIGEPQHVENAFKTLKEELAKLGCKCNPAKSQVLVRAGLHDQCTALASRVGATHSAKITVLGVPITGDNSLWTDTFVKWFEEFDASCTHVEEYAKQDSQGAMHMLIQSLQAKPAFIMETTDCHKTTLLAQKVDKRLLKVLAHIAEVKLPTLSTEQKRNLHDIARVPIKGGGVGFRPWQDQRTIAYLSSFVKASDNTHLFTSAINTDIEQFALKSNGPVTHAVQQLQEVAAFNNLNEEQRKRVLRPTNAKQVIGKETDEEMEDYNLTQRWRKEITHRLFEAYEIAYHNEHPGQHASTETLRNYAKLLEKTLWQAANGFSRPSTSKRSG
eukprot:m.349503 g.349503  ORF g.349503 m.349503 type:complete len:576 (-) comp16151_c1_seq4:1680-3407(-)